VVRVEHGQPLGIDLERLVARHNQLVRELVVNA
jgi:hypothetical protein